MLRALPIATFGDVADAGLVVRVSCQKCHTTRQLDLTDDALLARQIFGKRLRCSRPGCGGSGLPSIEPVERIKPGSAIVRATLFCDACVQSWHIRDVQLDQPPWSRVTLMHGDRFRCPGCGRRVEWHWHGLSGTPFTDGYRK